MAVELEALFEKIINPLADSFEKTVQMALEEYELLRQKGLKGKLSHIYLSFLWSSVLCSLPWFRIDLYDEQDRGDVVECFADWGVPSVSNALYNNAAGLAKQGGNIMDYEVEQAWLKESTDYFDSFQNFLPIIISHCPAIRNIECQWHFGQYLGEAIVILEKTNNEVF